jgi:hypothetical protein
MPASRTGAEVPPKQAAHDAAIGCRCYPLNAAAAAAGWLDVVL